MASTALLVVVFVFDLIAFALAVEQRRSTVQIQGSIPHHDNLRDMKLELLKRHHRPVSKDDNAFSYLQWILSLSSW